MDNDDLILVLTQRLLLSYERLGSSKNRHPTEISWIFQAIIGRTDITGKAHLLDL